MCGIKPTTMRMKTRIAPRGWCARRRVRRVPPLQGGDGLFGPSSQGVALGWRVLAPSVRQRVARRGANRSRVKSCANGAELISLGQRPRNATLRRFPSPEGARLVSPGQRPGNPATHRFISPERAARGSSDANAAGLCKVATRKEIEAQGWSLNPGRYVGVAAGEEVSDEDFREQFEELTAELETLNAEARELEDRITSNAARILEA